MGLDTDLILHDRELARQDADDEFREGIKDNVDLIKLALSVLDENNLKIIRSAAQDIIDDVNRRMPGKRNA